MTYDVVGLDFAHFHMGDNLRAVAEHPEARIAAVADENEAESTLGLAATAEEFDLGDDRVYRDYERCLDAVDPDLAICCPVPVEHAERVEPALERGVDVLLEKPMAGSVAEADRIRDAVADADAELLVNWPLVWTPSHRTTKRLIDEGAVGEVVEVRHFGGNRGGHRFTGVDYSEEGALHFEGDTEGGGPAENLADPDDGVPAAERTWWHDPDRGGGSIQDYLGYGTTLGTWFRDGDLPVEVSAGTFTPPHLEVDTHCVATARYETGLSTFESRWGTYTDPWVHEPRPRTGFVVVGTEGTIDSGDYDEAIRVQDADHPDGREVPVDDLEPPRSGPVEYAVSRLDGDRGPVELGPLRPDLSRDAQLIVDAAAESARRGEAVELADLDPRRD